MAAFNRDSINTTTNLDNTYLKIPLLRNSPYLYKHVMLKFIYSWLYSYMVSNLYGEKVKTTIMIDKKVWEEFRLKVNEDRGIRELSRAIEEALEDEAPSLLITQALNEIIGETRIIEEVKTIEPLKPTDAGKTIREMRSHRI